ncbi:MAG: hypothetical protein PWQ67_2534 [Clostridia bacterium]|jgi:hypothetical protein|nr:hypothetical protein [Clostridia bacterium]MDN5324080.1 hypothetical protein [Clostridia bacterium]
MNTILALFLLFILGGMTIYVLITKVIIPIYKIYQNQMQLK